MSKIHELKTDSEVFKAVLNGGKTFEIRYNDRNFQVGDSLLLRETRYTGDEMKNKPMHNEVIPGKPLEYTGRDILVDVTYIMQGPKYGLADGWCIMSIYKGR